MEPGDRLGDLQQGLREFARERDWEKYHTPQNLAALVSSEAGELLALFRWGQHPEEGNRTALEHELADVFLGVLRLADVVGVDLWDAAAAKLHLNAERYPAGRSGPDRPSGA
jgi:dCTP diphosphatase